VLPGDEEWPTACFGMFSGKIRLWLLEIVFGMKMGVIV